MSIINCPDCGRKISSRTAFSRCPYCGCPTEAIFRAHKRRKYIGLSLVGGLLLIGAINGGDKKEESQDSTQTTEETQSAQPIMESSKGNATTKSVESSNKDDKTLTDTQAEDVLITEYIETPAEEVDEVISVEETTATPPNDSL
ncbi:MAG: hypothetical protein K2H74_08760 [Paramuribaculum sp.]|nr:hypothetical protein [Paramuribaculum sp.]